MQATNLSYAFDNHAVQDDNSLQAWEQLSQRAQTFLALGKVESALATQIKALQVASRFLAGPLLHSQPDHCMAAWVVSHHNIADILVQRQQLPLALDYLCDAHVGLTRLENTHASNPLVQQAALRHQRETHGALRQWQSQHGSAAYIDAALRAPKLTPSGPQPPGSFIPGIRFPSSHLH